MHTHINLDKYMMFERKFRWIFSWQNVALKAFEVAQLLPFILKWPLQARYLYFPICRVPSTKIHMSCASKHILKISLFFNFLHFARELFTPILYVYIEWLFVTTPLAWICHVILPNRKRSLHQLKCYVICTLSEHISMHIHVKQLYIWLCKKLVLDVVES